MFFAAFLCFSAIIGIWKRADIFPWIGSCSAAGYTENSFMSYCHSSRYGDYEHRAYWHELESGLIEPVRNADVLFLGNSRTQYAFSTNAVKDFFNDNPFSHYVFGFGMGSQNFVAEKMLEKFSIRPKAVVINADPFFTDRISNTNAAMLEDSAIRRWEYKAKQWIQRQQRKACSNSAENTTFRSLLCGGEEETLFRDKRDGHWDVRYFRKNKQIPVESANAEIEPEQLEKAVSIARNFQRKTGLSAECIILTVTPRTATPLRFGQAISASLGWPGFFPMSDDLLTVDDSHLDPQSAERWSGEFLQQADQTLRRCTSPNTISEN